MSKLYLLLALVAAVAAVSMAQDENESDDLTAFVQFSAKFRKHFRSSSDRKASFAKFRKNRQLVQEVNADPNASFQVEVNYLSDQSLEDVVQTRTGLELPDEEFKSDLLPVESTRAKRQTAPASFDLSKYGSVWNQGQCGSCWAFTALEALEIKVNFAKGGNTTLSEQHLVDCDTYNNGCNGGWPTRAWDWLNVKKGSALASQYPYTQAAYSQGVRGTCVSKTFTSPFTKVNYTNLPELNPTSWTQQMVKFNSPIAVAIQVTSKFQSYKSGVFDDGIVYKKGQVNHAVLITGYGVDATTKLPFWNVKNSWGTGWGEKGYIRIKRGSNTVNIERYGMMPVNLA